MPTSSSILPTKADYDQRSIAQPAMERRLRWHGFSGWVRQLGQRQWISPKDLRHSISQLRFPIVTLLVFIGVIAAALSPAVTTVMQFDREAIEHGELWRLFTGHLTHWTQDHLIWDAAAFLILGIVCERRYPHGSRNLIRCLVVSALMISLAVFIIQPNMVLYRGLSGLNCALFALLAVNLWRQHRGFSLSKALLITLAGGFLINTIYELATADSLFMQTDTWTPAPLAHVIGAAAGLAVAWICTRNQSKNNPDSRRG